jgi:N-acetylmuramoyl-L-alanine amidase
MLNISESVTTPHRYKEGDRRNKPVDLLVMHYTAVPYWNKSSHGSNPRRISRWLQGGGRKSSTHFVVLRNGDIVQGASLESRTWHAGKSEFKTPSGETLKSINMRSIGLDFDNVGRLFQIKPGVFVDSYGYHNYKKTGKINTYKGPEPIEIDGKFWEPYSPESIESMKKLIQFLVSQFPALKGDTWRLVGHSDVRSTKSDPGPACPMDELRELLA